MALEFPQIDPVIFEVGPLAVRWYGLMYLVGFVLAMWLANRQAAKPGSGWTKEEVSDLLFYGMLGVILGGRLGYVFFYQFSYFLENPLYLFRIDQGGMSFHGGTLGVIAPYSGLLNRAVNRFLPLATLWRLWCRLACWRDA